MNHSPGKQVSGLRPFKNPRRRSSRGKPSRSGGSLTPPINPTFSWGSSPAYPPPYYSQPPLQRLNSSSLSPRQVSSSQPRVRSSTIPRAQIRGTMFETQQKKVEYIETVPGLARTVRFRSGLTTRVISRKDLMVIPVQRSCYYLLRRVVCPYLGLRSNRSSVATQKLPGK